MPKQYQVLKGHSFNKFDENATFVVPVLDEKGTVIISEREADEAVTKEICRFIGDTAKPAPPRAAPPPKPTPPTSPTHSTIPPTPPAPPPPARPVVANKSKDE